jgi:hypothetical protein
MARRVVRAVAIGVVRQRQCGLVFRENTDTARLSYTPRTHCSPLKDHCSVHKMSPEWVRLAWEWNPVGLLSAQRPTAARQVR